MSAPSSVEEVDAALARIGAVCDRMAERLVRLDGHEGQRLLDGCALGPDSRRRWERAKESIARLWADFEAYRGALDSARALRARRAKPSEEDLSKLSALVGGRLVEVAAGDGLPEWISFDELRERMAADYQEVSSLVERAAEVWSALARRLDPLTELVTATRLGADSIGAADDPELAAVAAELSVLRTADPLAADLVVEERVRTVEVRLAAVVERLESVRRLHDGYGSMRAELVRRLDEVGRAVAGVAQLHASVVSRIAAAPEPPAPAPLGPRLDELDALHAARDWAGLAARYREVDAEVAGALSAAGAAREGLQGLLDRRGELRGRLDAYRAKAGRLGHAEDPALLDLHREAHELLWAAPCDLAAATRAVAAYQRAVLAAVTHGGEVTR